RRIAANSEILSGSGLALLGLCVAVVFLVYLPVRLWMRYETLKHHATAMAEEFLGLLQQGKTRQAHRFSQLKYVFPTPETSPDPDKYMADKIMAEQLMPE